MTQQENDGLWRVRGRRTPLVDDAEKVARGLNQSLQWSGCVVLERRAEGSVVQVTIDHEGGVFVTHRRSRLIVLNAQVLEFCACPGRTAERWIEPAFVRIELCSNGKTEIRPMRIEDYEVLNCSARQELAYAAVVAVTMG